MAQADVRRQDFHQVALHREETEKNFLRDRLNTLWTKEERFSLPQWQIELVDLVQSIRFDVVVALFIVTAAVIAGLRQTTLARNNDDFLLVLVVLDYIVLVAFIVEVGLRMAAVWPKLKKKYFREAWNIFDVTIVVGGVIEVIVAHTVPAGEHKDYLSTVLRLVRLFRIVRIIRVIPDLQVQLIALAEALNRLFWVFVMLIIFYYIYAVIGVSFFQANDPFHFEDVGIACVTLFRIMTVDGWTFILYTAQYGCAQIGQVAPPDCTNNAHPIAAPLYFVSFIIFNSFVVLNLFVGVVVAVMVERKDEIVYGEMAVTRNDVDQKIRTAKKELAEIRELVRRHGKRSASGKRERGVTVQRAERRNPVQARARYRPRKGLTGGAHV